jgi:DNA-binding NarL/FixJ family response regulator
MSRIAVLDDRAPQRETLLKLIGAVLPAKWQCIAAPLLESAKGYPQWLMDEEVQVLIADQVLNEQAAEEGSQAVDYKAHQVIAAIRQALPSFPIYVVTSYPDDAELANHLGDAEGVMTRRELAENPKAYVSRMVRAGTKFAEDHQKDLAQLTELAKKAASGTATDADTERLRALQALIGLSADATQEGRGEALEAVEKQLDNLNVLKAEIDQVLKHKPRK